MNTQDQPHFEWPATFALAQAYVDQLERNRDMAYRNIAQIRQELIKAEKASGSTRTKMLDSLADNVENQVGEASNSEKVRNLAGTIRKLSAMPQ